MAVFFDLEEIMEAYGEGAFPMAPSRDSRGFTWYTAPLRSLLPLDLHVPRSLKKFIAKAPFEIRVDTDFEGVLKGCALPRDQEEGATWINRDLHDMMMFLHAQGAAHSVECWKDGKLVGGLYGVVQGAVFNGESMFSLESGASKVALVHLCERLRAGGFKMLDTQFINPHMKQFGVYEVPHAEYMERLRSFVTQKADFHALSNSCQDGQQPSGPGTAGPA